MAALAAGSSWLLHIRTFVDPELPASHQIASRDALLDLINVKALSLSQLVTEMESYLTSSDGAVRARGILLLGELWMLLVEQPLEDTLIHNFATFFSARLEDWHSLHGALVGSLALAKRGKNVGAILKEDAELLVESALKNLEVQALAQQDRMLCLELFECLLLHHSGAIAYHGALFADSICEVVEGEKDPRCLLLVFHIVEVTMELFPDPKGYIGKISEDLFDIISCYFPISFNPAPDDKRGITQEDLSMALMHCFASTKLFADSCIPVLLEKLSSTLKGAKRDSLQYLGYCTMHYGSEILQKHAAAIWMALKQELMLLCGIGEISPKEKDDQVLTDAKNCLQSCIRAFQAGSLDDIGVIEMNSFVQMILQDALLDDFIACLPSYLVRADEDAVNLTDVGIAGSPSSAMSIVSERAKDTIREIGSILATAVKASSFSCFAMLRTLFQRMFEVMKIGVHIHESDILDFLKGVPLKCTLSLPDPLMVSVLEVIDSLVEGAREVAEHFCMSLTESNTTITDTKWMTPLQSYSEVIVMSFSLAIVSSLQNDEIRETSLAKKVCETGVAGLQAMGSFPPQVSAISDGQFTFVVSFLKGIILKRSEVTTLWSQAVNAIAAICSMEEKFPDERRRQRLTDSLVSLLLDDLLNTGESLSIQSNLKALSIICNERPQALDVAVRKLTRMVCDELKRVSRMTDAEESAFKRAVSLLEGILHSILPCCESAALENDIMLELVVEMWNVVDCLPTSHNFENMEELPASYVAQSMKMLECSMGIFKVSVSKCDEQSQKMLLSKMFDPFIRASSNIVSHLKFRDVWIIGLFISVSAVLRPSIQIPQKDDILHRLLTAAVSPSCKIVNDAASEAVGYLLNKWHPNNDKTTNGIDCVITKATDFVLKGDWVPRGLDHESGSCDAHRGINDSLLKKKCIHLLACIGKGLAIRGHIAVSDIAILLLKLVECKRSFAHMGSDTLLEVLWPQDEEISAVSFSAAEALGFIAKDLKAAVTKQNHLIVKPLYQQRFFVCMLPPLMLALKEAATQERVMLYFAFGNLVSGIPTNVILTESKRVLPLVLESLSSLSGEERYSSVLLSVLLVLSAILVDKNGEQVSSQHVPAIVNRLLALISYPYSTVVRETTLLCLGALVALPFARVYPFRAQVLRSLTSALDDQKRAVRKEAVRCRRAWSSIAR